MSTNSILAAAQGGRLEVLFLLGVDEIDTSRLGKSFVVYIGHHGDRGAQRADVILRPPPPTVKKTQPMSTRKAARNVPIAPFFRWTGAARTCRLSLDCPMLEHGLAYDTLGALREAMGKAHPHLLRLDEVPHNAWRPFGIAGTLSLQPFAPCYRQFLYD